MLVDQFSDKNADFLRREIGDFDKNAFGRIKSATTNRPSDLTRDAYAFKDAQKFPVYNVKQACLSKMYAEKQAANVPDFVIDRIDKSIRLYGEDPSDFEPVQTKEASYDPSDFLLPHQQRLFVKTASDARDAGRTLVENRHRLKMSTLHDASRTLLEKSASMDVDVDDIPFDVYKYAGATTCDPGRLLDWIEAREAACVDHENGQKFRKIASTVKRNFPPDGVIEDTQQLRKIAEVLVEADKETGMEKLYGRTILDPYKTVFNKEKLAAANSVDLGGTEFSEQKIRNVPLDVYEQILGKEFDVESSSSPEFVQILRTLPDDMKRVLGNNLDAYAG